MPNYREAERGPNGEPIAVCDVTKPANNEVKRIMGTRIGFRDDGQREYLVKLSGMKALEWLTNNNMKHITGKLKDFKQTMAWSDWPIEEGREFMAAKPPTKPVYPPAKKGPNGEPIAMQCGERPTLGSIRRILGTRIRYAVGKHEYLVKVEGKDELVWLQEAHAGEFRELIGAYKKETGEPHIRKTRDIEYLVRPDAKSPTRRCNRDRSESHSDPFDFRNNFAAGVSLEDLNVQEEADNEEPQTADIHAPRRTSSAQPALDDVAQPPVAEPLVDFSAADFSPFDFDECTASLYPVAHSTPKPLRNLEKIHASASAKTTEQPGNFTSMVVPRDPSTSQSQSLSSKGTAVIKGQQLTVAKPSDTPVLEVRKLSSTEPLGNYTTSMNQSLPSNSAAVTKGQQTADAKPLDTPVLEVRKLASTEPLGKYTTTPMAHDSSENQKPTVDEPSAKPKVQKLASTEPLGKDSTTPVPRDPSANQDQSVPSNCSSQTTGHQPEVDAASGQQQDADGQRPGGSVTHAQPFRKKRPHAEVVSVEHGPAFAMHDPAVNKPMGSAGKRASPLEDATYQLAQDICNAGSKKAKMGESDQDRLIRLFHAAREAHNLDADLGIRCEKFVELIVDESFIGREPRDRRELFERLLEMCVEGMTLEDIGSDGPSNRLKVYSKRLQTWKVIREQFPGPLCEFKAQPNVASPYDALNEDAFKKINEYVGELRTAMRSMPKFMKEAVVWQLLGSVGHRYEQYDEGVHKRVADLIRKNVP